MTKEEFINELLSIANNQYRINYRDIINFINTDITKYLSSKECFVLTTDEGD